MRFLSRLYSFFNALKMSRRRTSIKTDEEEPFLAESKIGDSADIASSAANGKSGDSELRNRKKLPYDGKVYLPRKKKNEEDTYWFMSLNIWEILLLLGVFIFALYAFFYFENLHYHVVNGYAQLGYASAQHVMGHKYLHGVGVDKDHHKAMEWFKKAADQGHPQASYNVAIGHMKGIRRDLLKEGEAHKLIEHAKDQGVKEAHDVFHNICNQGKCN